MELKPGSRWKSIPCASEVVVVRPPKSPVTLECGGHAMVAAGLAVTAGAELAEAHANGTAAGKRYFDEESGIEVLGAKPGKGSLAVDGRPLQLKEAKPLPASD
jgi:hypothetical protein